MASIVTISNRRVREAAIAFLTPHRRPLPTAINGLAHSSPLAMSGAAFLLAANVTDRLSTADRAFLPTFSPRGPL